MTENFLQNLSASVEATVERVARSVVAVHAGERSSSSGFILRPGLAVTAEETVERDEGIELTLADGRRVNADLVGRDPSTDVALLRFEGAGEAIPTAPAARTGSLVLAIGRDRNGPIATLGALAQAGESWRSSQGGLIDALLRVDVTLARAAEGGVLVDAAGQLVGMPVFAPRRRVIAIPAATIARVAEQIESRGSISRGYVGVGLQPVRVSGEETAAMIISIDPDGPANAAGLLLGDIITRWNGEKVSGPRSLVDRLGPESVGTKVDVEVLRAGNPVKASLTVAARPKA